MPAPRKAADPDAVTLAEAAEILGTSEITVTRFRREGLLRRLPDYPTYSRRDIQEFVENPWLNGVQAAQILDVNPARVSQLATAEEIPFHLTASGEKVYRMKQVEVVAQTRRARRTKSSLLKATDGSEG